MFSKSQGRAFQIDAAQLGVAEAVVVETKAVFLREEDIINPDPDIFLAALRKSYGAATDKKERDKGVAQLAKSIGAIVRGEWTGAHGRIRRLAADLPGAARA